MANRPYVLLSVAMSIDGLINDTTPDGLPLSNEADFDRVDQVRAECDAILIGAGTLRNDNPRMTIKNPERRAQRLAAGKPEHLAKILRHRIRQGRHLVPLVPHPRPPDHLHHRPHRPRTTQPRRRPGRGRRCRPEHRL